MTIKSKQLFIILGDDKTGKTSIQKLLIDRICGHGYDRLPVNKIFEIRHPEIKRKYRNISFGNRSYQEKIDEYLSVNNYFEHHFQSADISFISSHLIEADVISMIENGKTRFYNVTGIFWTNSIENASKSNSIISQLDWNERLVIENPITEDMNTIEKQLNDIADSIVAFIANRTSIS